jgi:hypothetical protein
VVRSARDPTTTAPNAIPSAKTAPKILDIYLDVLGWGAGLNGQQRLIVRDAAMGYSWPAISDRLHLPVGEIRRRYDLAINALHRRACAG